MSIVNEARRLVNAIRSSEPNVVRFGEDSEVKVKVKPKIDLKKKKLKKLKMTLDFSAELPDDVELYIGVQGDLVSLARLQRDEDFRADVSFTRRF